MKHQLNSFKVALQGIIYAIKNESHMRFHLVAGFYVILFGLFYSFTVVQWAILILIIALIIMGEVFNTSIEKLCDLNTNGYNPLAKIAKDTAAGAVFVLCVGAVIIACLFYIDWQTITYISTYFLNNSCLLILLILSAIFSAVFVCLGPIGIKNLFYKTKNKK